VKQFFNSLADPKTFFVVFTLAVFAMLKWREFFTLPKVALTMFAGAAAFFWWGIANDKSFHDNITKPDNIPIIFMLFLVGYFSWLSLYRAVKNDRRIARGELPEEAVENPKKVLVWPDLVYSEFICMLIGTAVLVIWAVLLKAPLEEPANPNKTPNPSKAPWYFLGLQEMLVYFDPWLAGVILPGLIVNGLMAIPYLDYNKQGNGYYTINQRPFAYLTFQFGFLVLWITLIVMGTFLRGPNWNFFGFYETWDAHKVESLNNVDLSMWFWVDLLQMPRPAAPEGAKLPVRVAYIALRESPGILLVIGYLTALPPAMAVSIPFFRSLYIRMGFLRYMVMSNLLLMMLPLLLQLVMELLLSLFGGDRLTLEIQLLLFVLPKLLQVDIVFFFQ